MMERNTEDLKLSIIQRIYDGEVMYCDKKPVNKEVDILFSDVAKLWEENENNKVLEELIDKYTKIISLSEIEAFAKGILFANELNSDIKKLNNA